MRDVHAVVTGGSRGIGAAIAQRLAGEGARVTVMARDADRLAAFAATLPAALAVPVDVTDTASVQAAFERAVAGHGPVAVLVNNAGAAESAPLGRTDDALWSRMMDVNAGSVLRCTRAVAPAMVAAGWGRVVNVASTAGLTGYAYVSAYCAAKHAVVGLTRALARELATTGVTVNAVCPGYTRTDLLEASLQNIEARTGASRESAEQALLAGNPQRRFIEPAEVAAAVAWLCGEGSDGVTGQAIAIAGGEVM